MIKGWLSPAGEFHSVEVYFDEWAKQFVISNAPYDYLNWVITQHGTHVQDRYSDFLISVGWVLLHAPYQGQVVTSNGKINELQFDFISNNLTFFVLS